MEENVIQKRARQAGKTLSTLRASKGLPVKMIKVKVSEIDF